MQIRVSAYAFVREFGTLVLVLLSGVRRFEHGIRLFSYRATVRSTPGLTSRNPSDDALVATPHAEDRHAHKTLVERYQSRSFSMALDIVKNRKDAEDVAQENKKASCVGDTQAPSSLQPICLIQPNTYKFHQHNQIKPTKVTQRCHAHCQRNRDDLKSTHNQFLV